MTARLGDAWAPRSKHLGDAFACLVMDSTAIKQCASCGADFTEAQSSGKHCYRCKINSIGFTWRGPTRATRKNFSEQTIREAVSESMANEKANGTSKDMDFVGSRWV